MDSPTAGIPTLTPSRSPSPTPPVQPDHFFGSDDTRLPPSPNSDGHTWLDPEDDPLAHRGIPVFKPTMDEFADFEGYMTKVECWGLKSGIVKIIPPKEWTDALPSTKDQLAKVKIRTPIEQHMLGRGGLFRQENMEKRRVMSVREWSELCDKDEFRAPGVEDIGLHARGAKAKATKRSRKRGESVKADTEEPEEHVKEGVNVPTVGSDEAGSSHALPMSPPTSVGNPHTPPTADDQPDEPAPNEAEQGDVMDTSGQDAPDGESKEPEDKAKPKAKRAGPSREVRDAQLAERAAKDATFIEKFEPHRDWLPAHTTNDSYTPEFCQKLERQFWRNCGLGKPAWYGADTQGSLYTDETKVWNVGHLPSFLSRILPASSNGLPGVNTPYLYFGMWRATFAWHVEDMDLFSINYIHFGAPKFWYAVPQGRANALEQTMKGYFPKDISQCPQFLRHKSFLASPTLLAQSSCRPNFLVQKEGEFVITFPRGYHAGFNLGFNCAESVNFALESWLDLGRKAKACECVTDSVRIDVDQLLRDREDDRMNPPAPSPRTSSSSSKRRAPTKRKPDDGDALPQAKRAKTAPSSNASASTSKMTVTLKLGPKPAEPEPFPCCLCVSTSHEGLLPVHEPPVGRRDLPESLASLRAPERWLAHVECAKVVPETWIDEVDVEAEVGGNHENESGSEPKVKQARVLGVDAIVRDRWNLKCAACSKTRFKAHGAPIQCTKGKCAKSFHVGCARDGADNGILYSVLQEVEKEVVLVYPQPVVPAAKPTDAPEAQAPTGIADGTLMQVDSAQPVLSASGEAEPHVLKVIKKYEVQVLCTQHNPAVAAAKKASKQDKVRSELYALPPMSRIKIRVSAGVFEVSLVRIIEETKSVEVLWDRGVKREFKWGSVIFGHTDGQTVMQKPFEPAPDQPPPLPLASASSSSSSSLHVATFPSVSAATAASSSIAPSAPIPAPTHAHPYYQARAHYPPMGGYAPGAWPYQHVYHGHAYPPPPPAPTNQTSPYAYPAYYPHPHPAYQYPSESNSNPGQAQSGNNNSSNNNNYRAQLQWQRPYTGPSVQGSVVGYGGASPQVAPGS
ncbi:JmjC domain, hydroxylase-domain-containing protein [Hygrophoropsis aurantiaca]|uniref:JmjC domain, hydroxylase-domain-containing protein n=1 Tax=Hygrophoropsis aurantiaca TaxID=72124 RepID=A0ACB8A5B6_9AGAM|nr:JmjC domain, hydroxylase-domain-containing protein [Hygrophoropsis aurantiaca]